MKEDNAEIEQELQNGGISALPSIFKNLKEPHIYPNYLVCYIKLKYTQRGSIKGSGCFINDSYILTSAHLLTRFIREVQKLSEEQRLSALKQSYVKRALHEGQFLEEYVIEGYRISSNFLKLSSEEEESKSAYDYAILKVKPKNESNGKIQKIMPIMILGQASIKKITSGEIPGYPIEFNQIQYFKKKMQAADNSSLCMNDQKQSKLSNLQISKDLIFYQAETGKGLSGAPIIVWFNDEPFIFGIHKGGKDGFGDMKCGVYSGFIMNELNDWAYDELKQPFVFTQKTIKLRETGAEKLSSTDTLFLLNKNLTSYDINTITSFDISNMTKIILSGNKIRKEGFECLVKRPLPKIQIILLTENEITDLQNISPDYWSNISSLVSLGLSVNRLNNLPREMLALQKLQKLWITYNCFTSLPKELAEMKGLKTVWIYQNKFEQNEQYLKLAQQLKKKMNIVLKYQRNDAV